VPLKKQVLPKMNKFCGLVCVLIVLHDSSAADLVRRKRFFNTLWLSEEVKSDVQNGMTYSNLPAEYLYLLPGVNDHKLVQRRAGVQPPPPQLQQPQAVRFVHPTRMAILAQPQYHSNIVQSSNLKAPVANVQQQQLLGPKIIMKPFTPNLNPSITLKTREQPLPDIHKTQRFVAPKSAIRVNQPFNHQLQLPIKKVFDVAPAVISSSPLLTIKTAPITDFYYTKEFQELLKEFNIKVEIKKLPEIGDVMSILGTENAEETLAGIRDVAKSKEGMELIKSYLDQNTDRVEDDEFYNYDSDVGTGEIQVGGSEGVQSYQAPQQTYGVPQQQVYGVPSNSLPSTNYSPPINFPTTQNYPQPTTTGTLTGTGKSWWKPLSWFNSSPSTKVDSLQKDAAILKNVVPVGGVQENLEYIRNFLTPASRDTVPVTFPRRVFLQQPLKFQHSSVIESDTQFMPTVQMSEAQFQDMIKTLKLTPINNQRIQKSPLTISQPLFPPQVKQSETTQGTKFDSPINVVQNSRTAIPLPSTFEPQTTLELPKTEASRPDNRRNFISISEPQRASPYDFIATGRIHQANPDEVLKRSRSLAQAIEGKIETSFVYKLKKSQICFFL
jgi:hypothetical protein